MHAALPTLLLAIYAAAGNGRTGAESVPSIPALPAASAAIDGAVPAAIIAAPVMGSIEFQKTLDHVAEQTQAAASDAASVDGGSTAARTLFEKEATPEPSAATPAISLWTTQPAGWNWPTAAAGQPEEADIERAKSLWRDQAQPWLTARGRDQRTSEIFKALLQAGDYSSVASNLSSTIALIKRNSSLWERLTGRTPLGAVNEIARLLRGKTNSETARRARSRDGLDNDGLYLDWILEQVRQGRVSGYYARLLIGSMPNYALDDATMRAAMGLPDYFLPPTSR